MRVCMRVGAWVRSHFAEVSKIAQDAARAGTQAPERPPNTGTQVTTTRAAQEPEHKHQGESATRASVPAHAYSKRNYKNNSK